MTNTIEVLIKYVGGPAIVAIAAGVLANQWQPRKADAEMSLQRSRDGMAYVKQVLDPTIIPADRKRAYEYLVLAFQNDEAMKKWAEGGLTESKKDVKIYEDYISNLEEELGHRTNEIGSLQREVSRLVEKGTATCDESTARELDDAAQRLLETATKVDELNQKLRPENPFALNSEGRRLETEGRIREAGQRYELSCKLGYMPDCLNLAMQLHRRPNASPEDKARAGGLYETACLRQNAAACKTGELRMYKRLTVEECAAFVAQAAVPTTATARAPPLSDSRCRCA